MDLIETARGLSQLSGTLEVHTVSVGTDTNGAGSSAVNYDETKAGDVFVLVQGTDAGDYYVSSSGKKQATVQVTGATADSSVDVSVLVAESDT